MERSFKQEVAKLKLGEGETFHGEGILAVTKALLQSGVAYVGGYQGAPVSHMMDVLNDAREILDELGIHVESNASEAGAAAMLGASINYPMRGAVTFKSTVGTNVASDALSNLASAGVLGGDVCAGEAQDRRALARCRSLHQRKKAERDLRRGHARPRHPLPGRPVQRGDPCPAAARLRRRVWRLARADLLHERHLSAHSGGNHWILQKQGICAGSRGRPARLYRGSGARHAAPARRRWRQGARQGSSPHGG